MMRRHRPTEVSSQEAERYASDIADLRTLIPWSRAKTVPTW